MTREEWITCKVERKLIHEIDKIIASDKSFYHGSKKYRSRSDFLREACIRLIEQDFLKREVAA